MKLCQWKQLKERKTLTQQAYVKWQDAVLFWKKRIERDNIETMWTSEQWISLFNTSIIVFFCFISLILLSKLICLAFIGLKCFSEYGHCEYENGFLE